MNGFNYIAELYISHYNKMFWLIFLAAGTMFISSVALGMLGLHYLDLVLGLVIVAAGIHRIGEEFSNRSMRKANDDSMRTINELLQWAEKSYDYTREFKDKHEKRIYRLDQKRAAHEQKTEDMFRDAVRKIIHMENRMSKVIRTIERPDLIPITKPVSSAPATIKSGKQRPGSRAAVPESRKAEAPKPAKPPVPRVNDLNPAQSKAIQYLRRKGRITNKEYRQVFRATEKKAYSDLVAMYNMGLLRRRGKGRGTHYVLAF